MEAVLGDILVLPFFGQGHLFPCIELCKRLSSYNYKLILIIPSHLSSSIPSSLKQNHSLVEVLEIPASPLPPPPHLPPEVIEKEGSVLGQGPRPNHHHHHRDDKLGKGIESFVDERYKNLGRIRPLCVVMDVMMSWSKELFKKMEIPVVSFFTSGACSAAVEYAGWKEHVGDMKQGENRLLTGLPESMVLSYSEIRRRHPGPSRFPKFGRGGQPGGMHVGPPGPGQPFPEFGNNGWPGGMNFGPAGPGQPFPKFGRGGRPGGMNFGPPGLGQPPRWLEEVDGSTAVLINTCDDLEEPFLVYVSSQLGKKVLGVGPLLSDKYWRSVESKSVLYDDSRSKRESNYTEEEIVTWLDSKPSKSVIYVSFGSEVGPTLEEYGELENALGDLNRPFIWVIQPGSGRQGPPPGMFGDKPSSTKDEGYFPHELQEKIGRRGLIIKGWAPQLLILSHPSIGGFLSHCGWNSTVESIGLGVPILAWPIRGDQFYDAKLVVSHLKVGHMVVPNGGDFSDMVKKDEIMQQIEKLMGDEEVHNRAKGLRHIFGNGCPSTSMASLEEFLDLITPCHSMS